MESRVLLSTLRDAPISRKLMVIVMATTGVALLLAGLGIVGLDSFLFRNAMRNDLLSLARILGDNSTAALAFDDSRVATETLSALRARSHMVTACLYKQDGTVFAQYTRPGASPQCPPPAGKELVLFRGDGWVVSRPILLEGRRIGSLVLVYDVGQVVERVELYGLVVVVIMLLSGLLAFALSSQLRAVITNPISQLAVAAAAISESADYSIRVPKDSGDELGILVGAFNNMLGRIQSRDEEIQQARNSLETTLRSIADAVISTDAEGRIVFANTVAHTLLRWPREQDLAGRKIEEVFRIARESSREPVESPLQRVLRGESGEGPAEHIVLLTHDGAELPIDESVAPIRKNGKIAGAVLVFRDIGESRKAQRDAAYLAAIVESSDDAIIGKTPEGIIQTWNNGAERLYGFKSEDVVGHSMAELLPPDRQHEETGILKRMQAGSLAHFETVRMRKDGSTVEVSLTISPIRDKTGKMIGIAHMARDITDQKKAAEQIRQTQKLESLGVLAGGIAHDFNNLLTGILGNASIALEELPPFSPARDCLDAVITASERAAQLAQQMLAYSGKGRFVVEHIDFSERVRNILPLIRASIPPTVELRLNLEERLPPIEADAAQMQQLIMNVVINGAEAVPEGTHGKLTVTTRRQEVDDHYIHHHGGRGTSELKPGPYVLFEVTDTGCGMDAATLARIFDPFFTTKFTGRGLGLAAVLGIVRGHSGAIEILSKPGEGTTFRFLFPAVEAAVKPSLPEQKDGKLGFRGEGVVLVVDDEQIVRQMARQALERFGYAVLVAENGARGMEIFQREKDRIRCVVLDLTMPVMSGEETLERMKAMQPDIPIILSSGFNEQQAVQRFEGKGLAGFLQKPYRAAALAEKIQGAIAQRDGDYLRSAGSASSIT